MPADNTRGNNTCLVTGGAGFIGSAISGALADAFDNVVAVDNLHPQVHATTDRPDSLDGRVRLVVADVAEAQTWDELLSEVAPDVVVHLAAETGTGQSLSESTRHSRVNVVGTTQMLDAFHRTGKLPRRIVLTSSRAVYGEGAWRRDGELFYPGPRSRSMLERGVWDFHDSSPTAMDASLVEPRPASVYAATKLAQEQLLTLWADAHGVQPAIVRLQNVYGPGQSLNNPYTGIVSLFCRIAKRGDSIPLYEDGEVRRDFVLIDDVASAVVAATLSDEVWEHPLDIGSGEVQTIATAAAVIAERYGAPEPHVTGQFRHGDVRHAWADVARARQVLGWSPRYDLRAGIDRLGAWIDEQLD
ncbi:NAD-dependent epimerase/dehydratase family protein [Georgenia sp. AZ-5]|uniref:NAD-dependent epimerase/dehydratase family protein n=1 Tax=Georgenia sp. AZ-5 TaxID=3367526 RepID=UPI0037540F7B